MRDLISSPYEISVWEDVSVTEYFDKEGNKVNSYQDKTIVEVGEHTIQEDAEKTFNENTKIEEHSSSINYMEEQMVAIIGSDGMDSPSRAFEPCLKRNVNGTVTLSFYMFTKYFDEQVGDFVLNPFTNLMTNERKLKLKYKEEWYDLIIKNIDEDSEKYTMSISATSLPIVELARAGFNITLDNELKNSIGTITELANTIVEGTDWSVAEVGEGTDLLEEGLLENLYEIKAKNQIIVKNVRDESDLYFIQPGEIFYAFYSSYMDAKAGRANKLQIVYDSLNNYEVDEDNVIVISENPEVNKQYYAFNITYENNQLRQSGEIIAEYKEDPVESDIWISYVYKGEKLVHNTYQIYDPIVDKVCTLYESNYNVTIKEFDDQFQEIPSSADVDTEKLKEKVPEERLNDTLLFIKESQEGDWGLFSEITIAENIRCERTGGTDPIYFYEYQEENPERLWFTEEDVGKVGFLYIPQNDGGLAKIPWEITKQETETEGVSSQVIGMMISVMPFIIIMIVSVYSSDGSITGNEILIMGGYVDHIDIPKISKAGQQIDQLNPSNYQINQLNPSNYQTNQLNPSNGFDLSEYGITNVNEQTVLIQVTPCDPFTVYGYTESDYSVTQIIKNYVGDGNTFVNSEGWIEAVENSNQMRMTYYPGINSVYDPSQSVYKYLCVPHDNTTGQISTTVQSNLEQLEKGIIQGNKLVFKIQIGYARSDSGDNSYTPKTRPTTSSSLETNFTVQLIDYRQGLEGIEFGDVYCNFDALTKVQRGIFEDEDVDLNYPSYYAVGTILKGLTQEQIKKRSRKGVGVLSDPSKTWKIGLFICRNNEPVGNTYFGSVELFDYQEVVEQGTGSILIRPVGSVPTSEPQTLYNYFRYPESGALVKEDLIYLPNSNTTQENTSLTLKQRPYPFEKVRTVQGKQSNRFNLLQTLCETFECWLKFDISRDQQTGKINYIYDYNDDGIPINKHQDKKIYFKKAIGEHNYRGFYYGTNLKSIKRSIESDQIVTKMIVGINSNEFGKNGYCTIQRSAYNPIKEAFILNLDYYMKQGMLDQTDFLMDLTTSFDGHLNYYSELNKMQADNEEKLTEYSRLSRAEEDLISQITVYSTLAEKATEQKQQAYEDICSFTADYMVHYSDPIEAIKDMINSPSEYDLVDQSRPKAYYEKYITFDYNETLYLGLVEKLEPKKEEIHNQMLAINKEIEEETERKKELESKFYNKYARFIQEGSWIDESYYDDDLYYLDGQKVLYDSAFPQIKYTINVLDLDELYGYENYKYNLGDITYVEDTEFFGYVIKDGLKTPYKEEVLISETTDYLDQPEKNVITIQNFKTQFEDLFQRITATTQSLQYASGAYDRTTSIMNLDGTINEKMLSESLQNILATINNTLDRTTELGEDGILSKNRDNSDLQVKFQNGAIYTTRDGGDSWDEVLNPNGIEISKLTAGSINTKEILIYSGDHPTFRWDGDNLVAYKFASNENSTNINYKTYAVFNYNGLQVAQEGAVRVKAGYISEDLGYGFALYNKRGQLTLWADSETGNLFVEGTIYASAGEIGKWTIGTSSLHTNNNNLYLGTTGITASIGGTSRNDLVFKAGNNFGVTSGGILYANGADISGNISATSGTIGGWKVNSNSLTSNNGAIVLDSTGNSGVFFKATDNFYVDNTGSLHAVNGSFSGRINAGSITGTVVVGNGGVIKAGNLKIYESGGYGIIEYDGHQLRLDSLGEGYLRWGGWLVSEGLLCDDISTKNISASYVNVRYYNDPSHSVTLDAYDVEWIHQQRA